MGSAEAGRGNAVIRLLTDENLDGRIVRGVEMHHPEIDLLRVQETGAFEQEDEIVLALAAREDRVLLTHDLATIPTFAANRIAAGEPMPGVLIAPSQGRIASIIFEVALFTICSEPEEMRDRIVYLQVP
jgi:predicted nuclease of predicted toxin-antitoxin system